MVLLLSDSVTYFGLQVACTIFLIILIIFSDLTKVKTAVTVIGSVSNWKQHESECLQKYESLFHLAGNGVFMLEFLVLHKVLNEYDLNVRLTN